MRSSNGAVSSLSNREREIALLAARGMTDKEIQRHLGLSGSTIATYWKRIREKLQSVNRTEAIARILSERLPTSTQPTDGALTVCRDIVVTFAPGLWKPAWNRCQFDEPMRGSTPTGGAPNPRSMR
jgi:DNA-binding CsgD family transcriptional regulator